MKNPILITLFATFIACALLRAEPAAGGNLIDFSSLDAASLKTENEASASVVEEAGAKAVRVNFPASKGYPGVDFPSPDGAWDLSAFSGITVDITNEGGAKVGVSVRVENPGDWKQSPWNSEVGWLAPGASGTVTVTFGQSFGKPGFQLNPSAIKKVKIFLNTPGQEGSILIHAIRPEGAAKSGMRSTLDHRSLFVSLTSLRNIP